MSVVLCIFLFFSVSKCEIETVFARNVRSPPDPVDLDKLSDDDVFALLEKPEEDYEFPTEKDVDLFNFGKGLDEFDEWTTTSKPSPFSGDASVSKSINISTSTEQLPLSVDNSEGISKGLDYDVTSFETESTLIFTDQVPSSTENIERTSDSSDFDVTTFEVDSTSSTTAFSEKSTVSHSSTRNLPSSESYTEELSTIVYSPSSTTWNALTSSDVPFSSPSPEVSVILFTTDEVTESNVLTSTFKTPTTSSQLYVTDFPFTSELYTESPSLVSTPSSLEKITSTRSTETTVLDSQTSPSLPDISSSTSVQSTTEQLPKTTHETISSTRKLIIETNPSTAKPMLSKTTAAVTTTMSATAVTRGTTAIKSTKSSKKPNVKTTPLPKRKPTTISPAKNTPTKRASKVQPKFTATSTPTTLKPSISSTKRSSLTKALTSTANPTKGHIKGNNKYESTIKPTKDLPPYLVPSSNLSDSGPICFKLVKPDNTVSDECFYPFGIYPTKNPPSEKTTTLRTVFSTTEKMTTKKHGGNQICFRLIDPKNPSGECFYLDVNPSEAPSTEKIATLAPHRMFEITEEPPLPRETIPLVRPQHTNSQNINPKSADSEVATLAPNRIFDIPFLGSVPFDSKNRIDPRNKIEIRPISPVPTLAPNLKFYIPDNDQQIGPRNNYRSRQEPQHHHHSVTTPPQINQLPDQVPAKGKNVVRFHPRTRVQHPLQNVHRQPNLNYGRDGLAGAHNRGSGNPRIDYLDSSRKVDDDRVPKEHDIKANRNTQHVGWSGLRPPGSAPRGREGYEHPAGSIPLRVIINNQQAGAQIPLAESHMVLIPTYDRTPPNPLGHPGKEGTVQNGQHFMYIPGSRKGYAVGKLPSHLPEEIPLRVNIDNRQAAGERNPLAHRHVVLIPANDHSQGFPANEGSAQNRRQFMLIPTNPDSTGSMVSNVRLSAQSPHVGRHNPVPDDSKSRPAFFVRTQPLPEDTISNIRVRVPQQGTFSQQAYVSNTDPQRSVFDHLYLDVTKNSSSNSNEPHLRQYPIRYRRAAPGTPIDQTEAISLGFVVDTTASMRTELDEVKRYALTIMNEVLNNRGSHIGNFVFVPIHDVDPVHERHFLVTRDRNMMSSTISKINVWGGGTCPENSLVGLLKAIDLAEKDSHIFLFTDAYAQDYYLVPDIIKMIQRKKPRIYFLLTGKCKTAANDDQRYAFERIAAASTGIVAELDKDPDHIRMVLGAVAREFEKNRRIVTEHEGDATGVNPEDIKINVDPGLTNLSLTSTGQNTKIDVVGPSGRPKDIVQVLDMPNIQIISVPKPDPGEWTVSVSSPDSPFKFVASGISTTDFLYGFSVNPTNETSRLSKHPKQGVYNHLLLVAKDPSVLWNISNVQLVVDSFIFETLPINVVNKELGIYSSGPTHFPDTSFKIRINAFTKEGYPLTRLTKATIIPQKPGPPEIDCKREMIATAGLPFNMACSVESLIPMDVQMYKLGSGFRHTQRYSQTSEVVLSFARLENNDRGIYVINAKNSAGNASQNVTLIVEELPPSVDLERNMIVVPGGRKIIKCHITSYTRYSINWMKSEAPPNNFYRSGSYYLQTNNDNRIIEDNKVIIDPVRPEDEGWYICMARNGGGEKTAHSFLEVREPPVVSIDSFINVFKKGDRISITCRAEKGIPVATLSWFDNFGQRIKYGLNKRVEQREIDSLQLIIYGATRADEGTYTCFAENLAGRDSKEAVLQYIEVPRVVATENRVEVLSGESLRLQCNSSGVPAPKITWSRVTKDNPTPLPVESNRNKLPGQYLELEEVLPEHSGTYICTATNAGGAREDKIEVVVGFKPRIHHLAKRRPSEAKPSRQGFISKEGCLIELNQGGGGQPKAEVIATINQPIELSCSAFGIPVPIISWSRADGSPIRGKSIDGILQIQSAILEDGGLYDCLAQNSFGHASSATLLVVEGAVKPQLEKSSGVEIIKSIASQTVTLSCPVVESLPPPTISWYLNGHPVHKYPGIIVSKEDDSLTITNFNIKLTGNYTCQAVNPAGNDTKTMLLQLYDIPVIKPLPGIMSVVEGQRFSLTCEASGDPEPKIVWLKHDGSIVSVTNELLVERVQLSDAGKYLCRAMNLAGTEQTDFSLKVLIPPKIKEWESHTVAKVGERIRLHCDVSGDPPPKIKWFKNNRELIRIGIEYYSFEAMPFATGIYSCHASNEVGSAMVNTSVRILETPLIHDIAPVTEVIAGNAVDLKCSAIGNPYPTLSWIFNGETLVKQDVGNDSAVLHIQRVSESDAGNYYCLANSSVGNDRRKTELRVLQPPKVLCRTNTYHVIPGELAELHCDVSASPRATLTWYKDGDEFGFVSNEGTLQFIARQEDTGPFTMVATNKAGNDSQIVNVIVLEPPSFSQFQLDSVEAVVGTNVSLPCDALGDPKPEITWEQLNYPNKLTLNPTTGELQISNVELEDEGSYTCKAKNKAGISSHSVALNVLSRPQARLLSWDLRDGTIQERQEITLFCEASGKPFPDVTWTKDSFPLNPSNHTQNRNKLRFVTTESSSGVYSCTAKNTVGQDVASLHVNVTAKPWIKHSEDQYVTGLEGQQVALDCVVRGNPAPTVTWLRKGEELKAFPEFVVTEGQLIIPSLATTMEGSFTCRATNYLGVAEKLFRVTVHSLPVIRTNVPAVIEVYQLDDYAIPCRAEGKPTPTIQWKIGDELYSSGTFHDKYIVLGDGTLVIKNVTIEDAGKYHCIAKNVEGIDNKTHELIVSELPIVGYSLQHLIKENRKVDVEEVPEAGTKRLVCPGGKGEWLKNGSPLKNSGVERGDDPHYSLKDGGKVLLISDAIETDIANYSCVYPGGRHDFFVNVISKPFFFLDVFLPTETFEVSEGQAFVANCSARGNPDPWVSWQILDPVFGWIPYTNYSSEGIYFGGVQNDVLHIPEVKLIHNGTYKCTARNRLGKRSREFSIIWSGPPQLKGDRFVVKKIAVGQPLELNCEMRGIPEPTYSWEFQPNIKTSSPLRIPNIEKTLTIGSVTAENAGQYRCEASNSAGIELQAFDIQVIKPPVLSRTSMTSLTYRTFEDIELHCTSESVEDEVYWMRGEFRLTKSDRVSLTSTLVPNGKIHTLKIINASKDDADNNYKCIVFNKAGEAEQLFEIKIIVPPPVISGNSVIEIELGRPLSIPCGVEHGVDDELGWTKDGYPVKEEIIIDDEVQMGAIGKDDGGNYTCTVSNDAGNSSSTTFVKILVPPKMLDTGLPRVQVLKRGGKLELSCIAEGEPLPLLYWAINETHLVNGSSGNFSISSDGTKLMKGNITEVDSGSYKCIAINKASPPAEYYYEIIVEGEREDHVPNGTLSNITIQYNHSLELICPLAVLSKENTWHKGDQLLENNSSARVKVVAALSTLNIQNALPEDGAVYTCRIEGNYTVKTYTFAITVLIPRRWSNWTNWNDCSRTCGAGEQTRRRSCDLPPSLSSWVVEQNAKHLVQFNNDSCVGLSEDHRLCNVQPCPIDGGLSEWTPWNECSSSCGDGIQRRERRCDNPLPSPEGRPCEGDLFELRECKQNPCPIHGKWSDWSDWGPCSASCGYGVKHRDRQCNNPPPSNGGKYCEGNERRQEEVCKIPSCPGEGIWSEWTPFSNCSRPCGPLGFKKRTRICLNKRCGPQEKNSQRARCKVGIDVPPCGDRSRRVLKRRPRTVELLLNGILNGQQINDSTVIITAYANGSIALNTTNPLKMKDAWFPYMNFLVPPVTWTFAEEDGDSINGYSLSQGKFTHSSHYYFSTGEVLNVDSKGLGIGHDRKMKILVSLLGSTPEARLNEAVIINPYKDNFVQRGEVSLNSGSNGELLLDEKIVEYTWNSTTDILKQHFKEIVYPVENVKTDNIVVSYDEKYDLIWYSSASTITYRLGNEECPEGFALDSKKDHCKDIDECKQGHKCLFSQVCKNVVGSFECDCPNGFYWDLTTDMCQAVSIEDERMGDHDPALLSGPPVALACEPGFERIGMHCEDVNECLEGTPCGVEATCSNTVGSYQCTPAPCLDEAAVLLEDGSCVVWCNGSSTCRYGARLSESTKTIFVQQTFLEYAKEIAKLVIPGKTQEEYTEYKVTSSHPDLSFRIRSEQDYDVLYSLADAKVPERLTVNVFAMVYNEDRDIQRTGEFSVHIVNIANPSNGKSKRKRKHALV